MLRALKGLKDKHIIIAERRSDLDAGSLATNYQLHIKGTPGKKMNQGEVQNFATPPGSDFDHQQETVNQQTEAALAAALLDFGIDKPTVDRLVKNHDAALIAQKIDYVIFMQEEQPNLVRNPRGWLLKAIEYDYGPPAGYRPRAEREMLQARAEKRQKEAEDREAKRRLATEETISQHQTVQESIIAAAQEAYQTTAAEGKLWQEVLHHLRLLTSDVTYALIRDAQLLTTNDGTAIIGTVNPLSVRWLRNHLGTDLPAIFERCGQPVEAIQVLHLTPKEQ